MYIYFKLFRRLSICSTFMLNSWRAMISLSPCILNTFIVVVENKRSYGFKNYTFIQAKSNLKSKMSIFNLHNG